MGWNIHTSNNHLIIQIRPYPAVRIDQEPPAYVAVVVYSALHGAEPGQSVAKFRSILIMVYLS